MGSRFGSSSSCSKRMAPPPSLQVHVQWLDEAIERNVNAVLSDLAEGHNSAVNEAETFLQDCLSAGQRRVTEIRDAARGHGHAWRTVERAKHTLGTPKLPSRLQPISETHQGGCRPNRREVANMTRSPILRGLAVLGFYGLFGGNVGGLGTPVGGLPPKAAKHTSKNPVKSQGRQDDTYRENRCPWGSLAD